MHNHYIINELVEFHPATSTLRDIHHSDTIVVLNSPASRCLLFLINRIGTVVTQHEFMDIVWKQRGMTVTPNAYYQNISVLRKGLKRIGLGEDIIVTLPRIGLTLATGTRIRKLETETAIELTPPVVYASGTEMTDSTAMDATLVTEEVTEDHLLTLNSEPLRTYPPSHVKMAGLRNIQKKSVILTLLILITAATLTISLSTESDVFASYVTVWSEKGCNVLLPSSLSGSAGKELARNYAQSFSNDCQNHSWIYVSKIPNLPRVSVIRCDKPFTKARSCVSDYFIE